MDYNNPNDYWHGYDPYKGLSDEERIAAAILRIVYTCLGLLVAVLLCALLGSCTTTKYVPVVEHKTDTLLKYSTTRDSIYVHDSIHVRENGDTVTVERWHTRWRDRWHGDTVYQTRTDSVPVPYPVEVVKEVAKPLTWWQQARMHVGGIVIFLLIIFAVRKIYVTLHPRQ